MQGLLNVIEKRRALRGISDKTIDPEVVRRLMTAATYAPSCFNKQPWRFVVAIGEAAREKVRAGLAEGNYWALKAPVYVLAATKPDLD
ncbi:MAG: nitroreductase family protein, partial [Spirochaetota bacterium]|nr:nitroreductase family protein [Spirochaetota bacterium]